MLLAMAHATARNATNLSTLLQPGGSSEEHAFLRELEARTHEEDAVVATYDALPLFSTRDRIYNVEQPERWFDEELDDIIPSADLLILRGKHGDLRRLAEATGAFVEVPAPGDLVVLRRANREPRGRR